MSSDANGRQDEGVSSGAPLQVEVLKLLEVLGLRQRLIQRRRVPTKLTVPLARRRQRTEILRREHLRLLCKHDTRDDSEPGPDKRSRNAEQTTQTLKRGEGERAEGAERYLVDAKHLVHADHLLGRRVDLLPITIQVPD